MYTLTGWISVAVGFLSLLLFLPGVFQVIVSYSVDSAAVSIFVVILVELTNTVFVNSTNITTNIDDCQSRVIVPVKQSGTIWSKGLTVCFSICNCGIVATLWSAASSRKSFLDGKGFNQEDDEDDDITHLRRIMKIMW